MTGPAGAFGTAKSSLGLPQVISEQNLSIAN
jgi:hypothetical protein